MDGGWQVPGRQAQQLQVRHRVKVDGMVGALQDAACSMARLSARTGLSSFDLKQASSRTWWQSNPFADRDGMPRVPLRQPFQMKPGMKTCWPSLPLPPTLHFTCSFHISFSSLDDHDIDVHFRKKHPGCRCCSRSR